ncbi:MAG: hypothetical protein B7O98_08850 [Zestosphaera tikiterensis]|uniref:Uncharacterized protein n=1 Tax=Zestosphaera tikiterensis TaxID=1973259 RepID=A0A2R7Y2F8_9CREN|nr:MAG: hypothetical protein B7O98_08680 [Zestosphaera tikiterensis]PUA31721.1 MAG: hypothetical protein B7O98_08850 [Zestosphaera tikiterensis]
MLQVKKTNTERKGEFTSSGNQNQRNPKLLTQTPPGVFPVTTKRYADQKSSLISLSKQTIKRTKTKQKTQK